MPVALPENFQYTEPRCDPIPTAHTHCTIPSRKAKKILETKTMPTLFISSCRTDMILETRYMFEVEMTLV